MSEHTRRFLAPYVERDDLIAEFRANPLGPHSDELVHMMSVLRNVSPAGKYALIEIERDQRWALATLSGERGVAPTLVPGHEFTSLAEAEWVVFRLRWAYWTGRELS